jgi:hypothetical protein
MSYNPLTWKSFDLNNKVQQQNFLAQLSDMLSALNSPQGLANLLNGSGLLSVSSLSTVSFSLINLTANATVPVLGAAAISGVASVNTAFGALITFTGVPFSMRYSNSTGGTIGFGLAATDTGGNPVTIIAVGPGVGVNMTTTGLALTAFQSVIFSGVSYMTSSIVELDLVFNIS